ncbi:hypothetical protein JDV02_010474 [Purpureocillium takamizusanense]|uniref:2EXR domain-containing protein n=1 Tax=Purpureocillium takamizusanense TaxID=2060973 RepID=A0A9Q8QU36_9HYPO|nr:uncharacterized protein JDV02_010474 [Purpureocillium takamizusanense]UNI24749.1 hypothetical protein JDV02_010474 [Purpureocillium takamizusanense]
MPTAAFNVPPQYRRFTLFPHLPPEIRLRVWEEYLKSPGVSFVKVEPSETAWRSHFLMPLSFMQDDDDQDHPELHLDEVSLAIKKESVVKPPLSARLVAFYPVRVADISNYNMLHADLITMSRTYSESWTLARQLASREGALRLDNGMLVALDGSQDLITLDYLPPDLHQTDRALEVNISCPGLEKIRRAAVRVSPMWRPARTYPAKCKTCQEVHEVRDGGNCPTHLYQFLARHLPNLEEFYLLDYFVVEKSDSEKATWDILYGNGHDGAENACPGSHQRTFRAKDRIFHEIVGDGSSDRAWKTDSKTGKIRDWLQDSFVRYSNKSPLSRHESPEQVHFGILACQFNILPPSPSKAKTYPSSGKLRPARERPTKTKPSQGGLFFGGSLATASTLFLDEPGTSLGRLFDGEVATAWDVGVQNEILRQRPEPVHADADVAPQLVPERDQPRSWGGMLFSFGGISRISFRFTFSLFNGSVRRWAGF